MRFRIIQVLLEENLRKLEEIGLGKEDIKKIERTRWLIEYCKPSEIFLLKIAYLVKYRKPPLPKILGGNRKKAHQVMNKRARSIVSFMSETCQDALANYMKNHFEEFLFIPKDSLDHHHFKALADFLVSIGGISAVNLFIDLDIYLFEKDGIFLLSIELYDSSILWIEGKGRIWTFGGNVTEEFKDTVKTSIEFADKIFTSDWWMKVQEAGNLIKTLRRVSPEFSNRIHTLTEIKQWFDNLREIVPALMKLRKVPLDFVSMITTYTAKLLEEYLEFG